MYTPLHPVPLSCVGEEVRVYKNLHNGLWSVQAYVPGKGWRVVGHAKQVLLREVRFTVNLTIRARMHATYAATGHRAKQVHAYASGTLLPWHDRYGVELPITYNPWTDTAFSLKLVAPDHTPLLGHGGVVTHAAWAYCDTDRVWVVAPTG